MQRFAYTQKSMPLELGLLITALLVVNASLLTGRVCEPLIYFPEPLAMGEWWRAITFPFVHVSIYHLLLDASAFLTLYYGLREIPLLRRWSLVGSAALGCLLAAMLCSPPDRGLCGLSGIAHGLMAVTGLQLTTSKEVSLRKAGWFCVVIIVLKSLVELVMGDVLFYFLHVGSVGTPVAATHFGGVCGAVVGYWLFQVYSHRKGAMYND